MVEIVAECGINHGGKLGVAKDMVLAAKKAGCKIVKFQMFDKDDYADEKIKECWLSQNALTSLKEFCDEKDMEFLCTPETTKHIDFLESIGVQRYKVRHTDWNNKILLKRICKTGKTTIMSVIPEVFAHDLKANPIVCDPRVLICISKYPPSKEDLKILKGVEYQATYDGLSNHYPSILPCLIAIAYGAKIIEVHVMLKNTNCIDSAVSIDFDELAKLVWYAKEMEEML